MYYESEMHIEEVIPELTVLVYLVVWESWLTVFYEKNLTFIDHSWIQQSDALSTNTVAWNSRC